MAESGVSVTANKLGRRRAAGIYGAIITAAIIAAAGGNLPTTALVISVVVTLLVYWLAEEYAELLGEQAEGGQLPSRASIRGALAATWPIRSLPPTCRCSHSCWYGWPGPRLSWPPMSAWLRQSYC